MLENLADPTILGILLFAASATALVMLYVWSRTERKPEEIVAATSEWQPTNKIDFHCAEVPKDDKVPAAFLLRVEDYRTVESISGVEHVEIRWRNATLAEAKSVVVAHQRAAEPAAKVYEFNQQVIKKLGMAASASQ
jgi:hypothetical protein